MVAGGASEIKWNSMVKAHREAKTHFAFVGVSLSSALAI